MKITKFVKFIIILINIWWHSLFEAITVVHLYGNESILSLISFSIERFLYFWCKAANNSIVKLEKIILTKLVSIIFSNLTITLLS